jgi:hypothetical protein
VRPALRGGSGKEAGAAAGPAAASRAAAAAAAAAPGKGGAQARDVKLAPVECQALLSQLMSALLASCENLGRDGLAASMTQR